MSVASPSVSLILPNFNNASIVGLVLDRLAANTSYTNVEVVIVDDGSTDGSQEKLRAWRDSGDFAGEVRLIEKERNSGAIDSLNTALQAATGDLCVQIDSDASIETPGWIERMLELMTIDERVGVVTGKVVMDWGDIHGCGVHVVGPKGWHDRPSKLLEPVGRRKWHSRIERIPEGQGGDAETRVAEVDAGIGCCLMYRRADALEVGGYDTGYSPVWFDDVDLCISIRRLGRKVFYLPDIRVEHHLSKRGVPQKPVPKYNPRRASRAVGRRAARRLPHGARLAIERRFNADLDLQMKPGERERLDHHYRYWREKWGWDPCNPDMDEVLRRWGGTEVCWASDPARKAAGEEIVRRFEQQATAPAA